MEDTETKIKVMVTSWSVTSSTRVALHTQMYAQDSVHDPEKKKKIFIAWKPWHAMEWDVSILNILPLQLT